MHNNLWTREELILAFNLYLKLPFGKMHKHTPEIILLANLLGRTPSSIGMRLGNFASCDPQLQARGIRGLKGGMKQVRPIWEEFYNNQEDLVFLSEQILAERQEVTLEEKFKDVLLDIDHDAGKTKLSQVKVRVNQYVFRTMVLNNYYSKCCITGFDISGLLVASHIVPWSKNSKERLNPRNGICLNAIHDKAFDKGLITVTPDYLIKISPSIISSTNNKLFMGYFLAYHNRKIIVPDKFIPAQEFLEYHNDNIFIK